MDGDEHPTSGYRDAGHSRKRGVPAEPDHPAAPSRRSRPERSGPKVHGRSGALGRVVSFAGLAGTILGRPARLGACRAVAIDGPSGSGKSTFAARLGRALGRTGIRVEVVHTDEMLDGWDDQLTFWPRLETGLLEPIRQGRSGSHPVYDWTAGRFTTVRHVSRPDVLIVEGVSSAREEFRPELTYSVFLDADREVRFGRALARDGTQIAGPLRRWMAAEARYFTASATADRVDEQVDGSPRVRHDPESEYVRLR